MSERAKLNLGHGAKYPYDAPDKWWHAPSGSEPPPAPKDWAHAAARGIIAGLGDRRGIKVGFFDVDEQTRAEIVESIAEIIRAANAEQAIPTPSPADAG